MNSPASRSVFPLIARMRRDVQHTCPACARSVWPDEHRVNLRGDVYHAGCALYRRDRKVRV